MFRDKTNKGYHRLIVWQKAKTFVSLIYDVTESFPKSEEFGLKSQTRRATISVVLNLVEGYRRRSTKEFLRFLDIAWASLTEVEACLEIALDLSYITEKKLADVEEKRSEIAYMLNSLVLSLKNKGVK